MQGPRVYTVEEADELVPSLEAAFDRLDEIRARLRESKIKLDALEMIWGTAVREDDNPDHTEHAALLEELEKLRDAFNAELQELKDLGAEVKDLDMGLIDLFHVRDGRLVYLCWKRGEDAFVAWHEIGSGFANRQDL